MFNLLAKTLNHLRWFILIGWLGLCAGLFIFVPPSDPTTNEHKSFLPDKCTFRKAVKVLGDKFPDQCGLCEATIIFERKGKKLTPQDEACINTIASKIKNPDKSLPPTLRQDIKDMSVFSPGMMDLLILAGTGSDAWSQTVGWMRKNIKLPPSAPTMPNPLKSPITQKGQSQVIRINLPVEFVTYRASDIVKYIRDIVTNTPRPEGLNVAVTGSAGYGYDHGRFVSDSYDRTFTATLIAVIVILLLVYRAPIAGLIPLIAISIAAAITLKLMNIMQNYGVTIGTAEKIFVCVLMYGAGIDYSLLLIGRYRELRQNSEPHQKAVTEALSATAPAITASAATDALGILMLIFCDFLIFKTTGPVVAGALIIAMLASLTLVPAAISIFGQIMFWPRNLKSGERLISNPSHRIWNSVAKFVTTRPAFVLTATIIALLIPASQVPKANWIYDALAGIDGQYEKNVGNAAAGVGMAKDHWSAGEIAPVEMMIVSPEKLSKAKWQKISAALVNDISKIDGIDDVRSVSAAMGKKNGIPTGKLTRIFYRYFAYRQFLSSDGTTLRVEILMDLPAMGNAAMDMLTTLRNTTQKRLAEMNLPQCETHIAGITAHMEGIRQITRRDFRKVGMLVLAVIFVVVFLLLKDWLLAIVMTTSTLLSYCATLGICVMVSQLDCMSFVFGSGGLDWKVEIFLFVVVVAVGVDYNIFLAARMAQEAKTASPAQAAKKALVATGPVISSCGLVMAATLGSLLAGKVELLRQLGFALGLGMMIDTFVVRPLLLPAFAVLLKRTGKSSKLLG